MKIILVVNIIVIDLNHFLKQINIIIKTLSVNVSVAFLSASISAGSSKWSLVLTPLAPILSPCR